MKKQLKTVVSVFAALLLFSGVAFGEIPKFQVVSPSDAYLGMTYGDWAAAWWQWVIQIPDASNLFGDASTYDCNYGQTEVPVYFLVGGGGQKTTAKRTCTIPRGKAIFFPIINAECSTLEGGDFHGDNEYALRVCAASWVNPTIRSSMKVSIDGVRLHNLENMRAESPVFTFTSPTTTGNLQLQGTGMSVADGFWVLLKPLSVGTHTIHFEAQAPDKGNFQNVTYTLIVQ